jgi:hypothetical protein
VISGVSYTAKAILIIRDLIREKMLFRSTLQERQIVASSHSPRSLQNQAMKREGYRSGLTFNPPPGNARLCMSPDARRAWPPTKYAGKRLDLNSRGFGIVRWTAARERRSCVAGLPDRVTRMRNKPYLCDELWRNWSQFAH